MKYFLGFVLLFFVSSLLGQNKHSELYNKIKYISKMVLNKEIDSFPNKKENKIDTQTTKQLHIWYCELSFSLDTLPPILLINDCISEYHALDSLQEKSIHSIEVIFGNRPSTSALYGSRSLNGIISVKTNDYYYSSIKKKKRQSIK